MIHPNLPRLTVRLLGHVRRHPWREAVTLAVVSGIVFGFAFRLSLNMFLQKNLAVCWPLVGLEAAVLLRASRRQWPAILTGMIVSQVLMEWAEPKDELFADVLCDVFEVLITAYSMPHLKNLSDWMKQPRLLQRFIVWPMILGPAVTAFPVAAVFARELHISFWSYWSRWFLGDTLGIVLWLPMGIVLMSPEIYALFRWRALPRTVGLIGSLSLVGWGLFHMRPLSISFTLLPFLLLIALKLGFSGSVLAVNILSVVSSHGTLRHMGPFALIPEPYNVTTLQAYLAGAMLMCFPISIILLERDSFERGIKEAYQRMEQLAISDALTGLANRRRFDTVFDQEWHRAMRVGEPIALMMIDVDCFKLYNDLYGHLAGDDCLQSIAESLRNTLKRAGDLPARYGGEEFVVLMPRTDLSEALEVAEMVRKHVELLQLEHEGNPHKIVSISIGCWSTIPESSILPKSLIEAADQGLYSAKQTGRNKVATLQFEGIMECVSKAS